MVKRQTALSLEAYPFWGEFDIGSSERKELVRGKTRGTLSNTQLTDYQHYCTLGRPRQTRKLGKKGIHPPCSLCASRVQQSPPKSGLPRVSSLSLYCRCATVGAVATIFTVYKCHPLCKGPPKDLFRPSLWLALWPKQTDRVAHHALMEAKPVMCPAQQVIDALRDI